MKKTRKFRFVLLLIIVLMLCMILPIGSLAGRPGGGNNYHHLDIRVPAEYNTTIYTDGIAGNTVTEKIGDDDGERIVLNGVYLYANGTQLDKRTDRVSMNSSLSRDGNEYEFTGTNRYMQFNINNTVYIDCDIYVELDGTLQTFKGQEFTSKLSDLTNVCNTQNSSSYMRGFDFVFSYSNIEYRVGNTTYNFEKVWAGDSGDTTHRSDVTINAFKDRTVVDSVQLSEKSSWKGSVTLANGSYDNSNKWTAFSYDFKEADSGNWTDYYTAASDYSIVNVKDGGDSKSVYTFTNTYKNRIDVTVTKTWSDFNNIEKLRPSEIYLKLVYSDGSAVDGVKIAKVNVDTADNTDSYTFTDLPEFDSEYNRIGYSVVETDKDGNAYAGAYTGNVTVSGYAVSVVNTYNPTVDINFTKNWNDCNNADDSRPDSIFIALYASDSLVNVAEIANGETGCVFDGEAHGLNKYNADGSLKNYTVREVKDSDGTPFNAGELLYDYYTASAVETTGDYSYAITNTYIPKTSVTATKVWYDFNNEDGVRPEKIFLALLANNAVKDIAEIDSIDGDDEDGSATTDTQTYTFTELDKYTADGTLINYSIKEVGDSEGAAYVPINGYTALYNESDPYSVTNEYSPKISVTVTKNWDDYNDEDSIRPETITVTLLGNNIVIGEYVIKAEDSWVLPINNLPRYDSNNKVISYTVREEPENYTVEYGTYSSDDDGDTSVTITNSYMPKVDVKVTKDWANTPTGYADGITVTYKLYSSESAVAVGEKTVGKTENWACEWTGLNKYPEGSTTPIAYTVTEELSPEVAENFDIRVSTDSDETDNFAFTVTNTNTETVDVEGMKHWKNVPDDALPESITVRLYADGVEVADSEKTVTADKDGAWKWAWTGLAKYADSKEVVYTVSEDSVDGYESSVEGYDIFNTNIKTVQVTATKVWEDFDDEDGIRPDSVALQVFFDNELFDVEQGILNAENGWKYTWNLPKYIDGAPAVYTVKETLNAGDTAYTVSYSEDTLTVTNSHMPKVSKTVSKIWDDADNANGLRPETIEIALYADGVATGLTAVLNSENRSYTWNGLDKYNADKTEIVYSVSEISIDENYFVSYSEDTFTITNKFVPTVSKTVNIIWNDADNQDGIRPENVKVELYANGELFGEATDVSVKDNTFTWRNLREYDDDNKAIVYTVKEIQPNGYTVSYSADTFTITNKYTPQKTDVTAKVVWVDRNNVDNTRPYSVNVQLYADGVKHGDPVEITAEMKWEYTWAGLTKFSAGEEIVYTVQQIPVPEQYIATYDGDSLVIINTQSVNQDTGDNMALYAAITILLLGGAVFLITFLHRKRVK